MKKRILKILILLVVIIVVVVGGFLGAAEYNFYRKSHALHDVSTLNLRLAPSANWASEGEQLAKVKGCYDCHGTDLGGKTFVDDPMFGTYSGPNLTRGRGGIGANFTDQDFVRAIRYGIGPDHRYLNFMPSSEYSKLSDEDLGRLIAYIKSLPPVDRASVPIRAGIVAKVLDLLGKMPLLFPGAQVDVSHLPPVAVKEEATAAYGRYLAAACVGCHGPMFSGGPIPGVPPSWPPAANLTPAGDLAHWTLSDFERTLKTGVTPAGKKMDSQYMPWKSLANMSDTDMQAIFRFLSSLPPVKKAR